jgi:hypothetical protein
MRKIKAKVVEIDGKPITAEYNLAELQAGASVKFDFDSHLDFILYCIEVFTTIVVKTIKDKKNRETGLKEITEMRDYLSSRVTSLVIKKNETAKEGEHPYNYQVDYKLHKLDTIKEIEEVEAKIKGYLHSDLFNLILAIADPNLLSLLLKEEELRKREEALNKKEAEINRKTGKFKRSGHLTDQMLKYNYPKNKLPSLFDVLQSETLKDIEVAGVEVTQLVEGVKLSPSETKVIDCLSKLLHEASQNSDPTKEDYYSGNMGYDLVDYGGDKNTPAPRIGFTLYQLAKEYKGGEAISGKDLENVKQIINDLDNKRFLFTQVETTRKKDGGRIERKIEDFRKLIGIVKLSQTEYSKEDLQLSKTEEVVIVLNPIFRRQIDTKFILYPNDINSRTVIAYGSHNISEIALRLRDYLMRELSYKHYTPEISLDKLYYQLAEKWMKESRKKKVKEYTDKALETVKNLGLLISYEIKTGATGEPKIVFTLNKDWD